MHWKIKFILEEIKNYDFLSFDSEFNDLRALMFGKNKLPEEKGYDKDVDTIIDDQINIEQF